MAAIEFVLFWTPIAFGIFVAASYIGTKLALRSYFDDEEIEVSDVFRLEDDEGDQ
ncbi:hypothetical protein [Halopenitus persicus]|jgi:hypothetical protein|uniref:Uncharacterized protein n=1 Tax=Halopenitus persicus TaxID=1048396 RepID=A0A1H3JWN7_9EURY|nr:hypothetical protein [Halopenitus persicus]QHS15734.1 hypothetical protein GWK26_00440 [haloarchaeon 3A1-DGR]SDY44029.1 hypothetical protein SAMN05216564_105159 [Halopenitus persicus]